ncbi:MAG: PfaD family polyunsaturated fatty acid/polyketide biosynthesis protein [gamma proteobacterium symbiont of Taylorina sp.]|nr:PfaD family polyunsaturated fatty acid/polyketide biosynthesis protein [gamma proteobacterium symbiont of Taylorina sp.]
MTVLEGIQGIENLKNLDKPAYVMLDNDQITINNEGCADVAKITAYVPPVVPEQLGDPQFKAFYGVKYAYMTGAMANGISSEELVISLGQRNILASFGAGGLDLQRVELAIKKIQQALPNGPYVFNFIHNPSEPAIEQGTIDLYLKYGVNVIEAAAFFTLTPSLVYFRAKGLVQAQDGSIQIHNKIIGKVSRREVATVFMQPAPEAIVNQLLAQGAITQQQAQLAMQVPMADDITVEADSGGHTDNRPLSVLLPSIIALRDEVQAQRQYPVEIRVGAGGGVGTPDAALACYMMGAAYVVTGSVNQSCIEAGASEHTRKLLAEAGMADVVMAPASDMFERGIKLQVLKKGTLFPMRAQKLYELYTTYNGLSDIPKPELEKLEKQILQNSVDTIWQETVKFFQQRDPSIIEKAQNNPKKQMALVFRWYLGLSSRWSNAGVAGREFDYQIWSGPAMGAFNDWVAPTYLKDYKNRRVADVAEHLMYGAAYHHRIQVLKSQGLYLPAQYQRYIPENVRI